MDGELDAADFDAIEYINRKFPTESSLEGLDPFLGRTDREVKHLDEAISEVTTHMSNVNASPALTVTQ